MSNEQNAGRVVLVTGATGMQGGAVARHVLGRGFRVRALTRSPEKPAARALAEQGVEVVRGDLDDRASLDQAIEGTYGVFSVQNFLETGYEREIQQGVTLADAAKAAGVQHFVYSSVGSAHRKTGIPHFESKWQIEEHVRGIGLPYTVLRPVAFMSNWEIPFLRNPLLGGTLAQPLDPDRSLQQVSGDDFGAFVAMALAHPDKWIGRALDVASDELTMPQVAETFSRVMDRPVRYVQVPWNQFRARAGEEMNIMYQWFNDVGYEADIAALREEYPNLTTLEQYLRSYSWERPEAPVEA